MKWFRVYAALLNNPKFQRLRDELKVLLFNLWCIAADHDGVLPAIEDIAFLLRAPADTTNRGVIELKDAGFIDETDRGIQPHDWNIHQCVSDVSTGRVKKHREKRSMKHGNDVSRNGHETFHETEVKRPREEERREELENSENHRSTADAVERDDDSLGLSNVVRMNPQSDPVAEWFRADFWPVYPRHEAKQQALKAALAQLKTAALREAAMTGLRNQLPELKSRDPKMIPLPASWINGRRWEDEAPAVRTGGDDVYAQAARGALAAIAKRKAQSQ